MRTGPDIVKVTGIMMMEEETGSHTDRFNVNI